MRTLTETVPVRGGPAQTVELLFTRHGPVTWVDRTKHRAYAVRSGWFEPGTAPYFGSIQYMGAKDFAEFRRAMAHWGAPAENQVYADVGGRIGWVTGGLAPKRPNWDGLLPVPGDGRYEWAGFWSGDELPWLLDPPAGFFVTANEQNLPAGYPVRERKLGFEWAPTSRHRRISEVLARQPKVGIDDTLRLQNDVLSVAARRLQAVLKTYTPKDARARSATRLLGGWNAQVSADSAAAALFEVWWSRHLAVAFKDAVLPPAAAAVLLGADHEPLISALEKPEARFGANAVARRDAVLEASLVAAWLDLQRLAGADPAKWRWGALHHALFAHPLANAAEEPTRNRLNVGPLPKGGGSDTVNLSSYEPGSFRLVGGPSFRIVLDVGNWDNSRAVNAPGQSGDPASPHYRDLVPLWLKGETFPLLYSRPKIEAALSRRIELLPAR